MQTFTITFRDTLSGAEFYAISLQARSKGAAVDKAYRVAAAIGHNVNDRYVAHRVA